MNQDVEIKTSLIEGRGIFAKKDFNPGETVLVWDTSHELSEEEREALPQSEKPFTCRLNGKWILVQEPERFMNHSCEANTISGEGKDVAVRAIAEGEEITADYRGEMKIGSRMDCHCGAASCNGYIEGTAA